MAAGHKFFKVTGSLSGLTRPDKLALRSWDITVPSTGDAKEFPQFRSIAGNVLTLIVSASAVANATGSYSVDYVQQTDAGNRGHFEERIGDATNNQMNITEVN